MPGSAQPDLIVAPDGRLLLSWVEPAGERGHRLQLAATLAGETGWAPALAVAEGEGWFVNWADTPRVQALADGSLWAHWLERTGPSRMDYGIAHNICFHNIFKPDYSSHMRSSFHFISASEGHPCDYC